MHRAIPATLGVVALLAAPAAAGADSVIVKHKAAGPTTRALASSTGSP